jgi:hypothetical protein
VIRIGRLKSTSFLLAAPSPKIIPREEKEKTIEKLAVCGVGWRDLNSFLLLLAFSSSQNTTKLSYYTVPEFRCDIINF